VKRKPPFKKGQSVTCKIDSGIPYIHKGEQYIVIACHWQAFAWGSGWMVWYGHDIDYGMVASIGVVDAGYFLSQKS